MRVERREFIAALGSLLLKSQPSSASISSTATPNAGQSPSLRPAPQCALWEKIDLAIKAQWDGGLTHATEEQIRQDSRHNLMFLPFPYYGPTGPGELFGNMFAWDTPDFTSRALMADDRYDLALNHFKNYLFMVERIGYVPNANTVSAGTRSQTPLFPDTLWRYYESTRDRQLLMMAYPILTKNYREYWNAAHHRTPTGLATNRDLGDPILPPALAAEAETGRDWTPIYAGDVRRCVPLITNCALVRFARVLSYMAKALGILSQAKAFARDASRRSALIRQFCWNESRGLFLEYDYVAGRQLPYVSDNAYWPLWAEVATASQAEALVANLHLLEQPYGLACTDTAYPLPRPAADYAYAGSVDAEGKPFLAPEARPETAGGRGQMQWMYPVAFAPVELIPVEGLDRYGYSRHATRIAANYLGMLMDQHQRTGKLWEKYNVVDGSLIVPNSRYGNVPMMGWTAAAVALLGRRLFKRQSLLNL